MAWKCRNIRKKNRHCCLDFWNEGMLQRRNADYWPIDGQWNSWKMAAKLMFLPNFVVCHANVCDWSCLSQCTDNGWLPESKIWWLGICFTTFCLELQRFIIIEFQRLSVYVGFQHHVHPRQLIYYEVWFILFTVWRVVMNCSDWIFITNSTTFHLIIDCFIDQLTAV